MLSFVWFPRKRVHPSRRPHFQRRQTALTFLYVIVLFLHVLLLKVFWPIGWNGKCACHAYAGQKNLCSESASVCHGHRSMGICSAIPSLRRVEQVVDWRCKSRNHIVFHCEAAVAQILDGSNQWLCPRCDRKAGHHRQVDLLTSKMCLEVLQTFFNQVNGPKIERMGCSIYLEQSSEIHHS